MDGGYNKNFVGKDNPNFKYDTRKDFKALREQAMQNQADDSEDDWDWEYLSQLHHIKWLDRH